MAEVKFEVQEVHRCESRLLLQSKVENIPPESFCCSVHNGTPFFTMFMVDKMALAMALEIIKACSFLPCSKPAATSGAAKRRADKRKIFISLSSEKDLSREDNKVEALIGHNE